MHFYVAVDISGISSLGGVATPITMENYSYFPIVTMNEVCAMTIMSSMYALLCTG